MSDWAGIGNLTRLRETIWRLQQIEEAYTRQEGFCIECGAGPLEDFQTHHVRPRRAGGPHSSSNLEIVCRTECHAKRERRSERMYGLKHNR